MQDTAATLLDEFGVTVEGTRVDAGALAPGLGADAGGFGRSAVSRGCDKREFMASAYWG
ncbi:hypothetical protein E3D03_008415 [Paracoccus sp. DMF]|nr:hypothetical protein [Paracoccus sp. DMF]